MARNSVSSYALWLFVFGLVAFPIALIDLFKNTTEPKRQIYFNLVASAIALIAGFYLWWVMPTDRLL
jgi:hypothetical protein